MTLSKLKDVGIYALFILYLYLLFKIILFKFQPIDLTFLWEQLLRNLSDPVGMSRRLQAGNLTPFKEISRTFDSISNHGLVNLVGNVAIFIPFGIFLGLMSENRRLTYWGAFLRSFGISLCLEGTQVLCSIGSFDVDDLILNTCGGIVGYLVFRVALRRDQSRRV